MSAKLGIFCIFYHLCTMMPNWNAFNARQGWCSCLMNLTFRRIFFCTMKYLCTFLLQYHPKNPTIFKSLLSRNVVKVNLMKNELFHLGGLPTTRFGLCTDSHSNAHVQWKPDRPERTFVWCAMFRKWKILKERFNHFTNPKFRKDFRYFNYLFLLTWRILVLT